MSVSDWPYERKLPGDCPRLGEVTEGQIRAYNLGRSQDPGVRMNHLG